MSIEIGRFITQCKASSRAKISKGLLEDVVRQRFANECAVQLNSQPAFHSQVIRIHQLTVRLSVTADELEFDTLARALAAAFLRQLFTTVGSPNTAGAEVVHARTRAEWLARFIADVFSGSAAGRWEYEEFQEALQLGTSGCVLSVLSEEPWESVPVLLLLDESKRLDPLLTVFDDLAFEKLFALIAGTTGNETSEPAVEDLLAIGALAASPGRRGVLDSRPRALRIFLELSRTREPIRDRALTPRIVFHALMTLDALAELTQSLPYESWFQALAPEALARRTAPRLHPVVLEVVAKIWTMATLTNDKVGNQKLEELARLILEFNPLPAVDRSGEKRARWVSSECAGLLLLAGLLDRLGWVQRIRVSPFGMRLESRAVNFCLLTLALKVLGQSAETERLDPGVLIFSGWAQPEFADLGAFRSFLNSLSESEQRDLVDLLTDDEPTKSFVNWHTTFDHLAAIMIREFAGRLRGFHQANPEFLVKTFFKRPGRIFIDDQIIRVVLEPNPFHIALRISSMDEPVDSVSWLGGRRLEFQLEGL